MRVAVPLSTIVHDVDDSLLPAARRRAPDGARARMKARAAVVQGLAGGREEPLAARGRSTRRRRRGHVADPRPCALSVDPRIAVPLPRDFDDMLHVDLTSYVRDDDTPDPTTWSLSGEGVDVVWEKVGASVSRREPSARQTALYLQVRDPGATKP